MSQEVNRFVNVIGVDKAENRSKDLGVRELAVFWQIVQDCRLDEVSALVLRNFRVAAIEQNFRAFLLPDSDQ